MYACVCVCVYVCVCVCVTWYAARVNQYLRPSPVIYIQIGMKSVNSFYFIQVLMPPHGNVFDLLQERSEFSQLVKLMKETGIADTLQEEGPFTIFAPTNKVTKSLLYLTCRMSYVYSKYLSLSLSLSLTLHGYIMGEMVEISQY